VARQLHPPGFEAAASVLAGAAAGGEMVRIAGGKTKLHWGAQAAEPDVELHTTALDQIVEHNAGDFTAVLQSGVPLARAQLELAREGQMVALDPWLGQMHQATIGGIVATGDSGPLSHRYGTPRDLILGMTVALSDGTVARSGGKVIKNVAGYDLAKLFCGSFGTLGLVLSVNLRLHPLPPATVTAIGFSGEPAALAAAARELAAAPLELEALDVCWSKDGGRILARCAGKQPARRGERATAAMRAAGIERTDVVPEDRELWDEQRAGQRSVRAALVRIAARPSQLASVLGAARSCGGRLVGRAALGSSFIEVDPAAVPALRGQLPSGVVSIVLDAPAASVEELDRWGEAPGETTLELMRRIKARFDPAGVCNPGIFVGGI
jgi:glycolate oxidase FAD binding subunit